jgi:hypothetical protein
MTREELEVWTRFAAASLSDGNASDRAIHASAMAADKMLEEWNKRAVGLDQIPAGLTVAMAVRSLKEIAAWANAEAIARNSKSSREILQICLNLGITP